jgi:hypothetical protein
MVSFTPRPFYPQGKSHCYPLDRGLGGPQSRSGRGGEEKNSQPPPGIESDILFIVQLLSARISVDVLLKSDPELICN